MRSKVGMVTVVIALVFLFTCSVYALECPDVSDKCPNKSLCVVDPNGGEVLVSGTTFVVKVKVTPEAFPTNASVKKYKLYYSLNNGVAGSWKYIGERTCAPESHCYPCFPWVVPVVGEIKNQSLVKVVALDAKDKKMGKDISNNLFTIQPTTGVPECNDLSDNDHDGLTDFPADPDCASTSDNSEAL